MISTSSEYSFGPRLGGQRRHNLQWEMVVERLRAALDHPVPHVEQPLTEASLGLLPQFVPRLVGGTQCNIHLLWAARHERGLTTVPGYVRDNVEQVEDGGGVLVGPNVYHLPV